MPVKVKWVRTRRVRHVLWVKQFVLDEGEEGRDHFRANQLADDD